MAAVALGAIALTPATAFAWTPGTHIFLGEAIMRSLALIPSSIAQVIAAFPYDFLYGSIAADTSIPPPDVVMILLPLNEKMPMRPNTPEDFFP